MRRAKIGRWLLGLVLLGTAAGAAGGWYLSGSLPRTAGSMTFPGLERPVQIVRDDNGVPHIFATTETDGYFAMGVVHGQDRLWQMETLRRVAGGRLSELTGPATVGLDTFFRMLGFEARVADDFAALDPTARRLIEAYAAGVNAGAAGLDRLPPEFLALRTTPEPWRPVDSLLIAKLMGVRLGENRRDEMLYAAMTTRLKPGAMKSLFPEWDEADEETFRETVLGRRDFAGAVPLSKFAGVPEGLPTASNAWAVGGNRSTTGKPLLANDPHLGLEAPILWYLARLDVDDRDIAGATLPGMPFHILGQNGRIAWGLTTTGADTEDLFIERVAEADPTRYETPNGTLGFRTETFAIGVKGEAPRAVKLRHTRHGPVISDIDPDLATLAGKGHVIALATASAGAPDTTLEVPWRLAHAGNWAEAREALRPMVAPVQNFTVADASGTIARRVAGRVPVRSGGSGLLPAPGWTGTHDWTGFVPFDDLPEVTEGADGRVVNGNNSWGAEDGPVLAHIWHPDLRYRRAVELIDATALHDIDSFRAIQTDVQAQDAEVLLPLLLERAKPAAGKAADAIGRLGKWDRTMDTDSVGAMIFEAWLRELNREIFADELGDVFPSFWSYRAPLVARLIEADSPWCDKIDTADTFEDCAVVAAAALDRALAWLTEHVGPEMDDWQWGSLHRAELTHAIFKRLPVLSWWTDLSRPAPGGNFTLNRGAGPISSDDTAFSNNHGPGYRAVYDLANPDRSRYVIATGQSGNPLSRHWGDIAGRWQRGELFAIAGTLDDLIARRYSRLVLEPAP